MAKEFGVKTLLDTDGEALIEGVQAGPTVVVPNQQEAERLLDTALITHSHAVNAVEQIRRRGAESAIVSLGSRGAIGATASGLIECIPPQIDAVCPIGSGDALAAAFVWSRARGDRLSEALRWGVAAGSASSLLPGLRFADLAQTTEMFQRIEVHKG